jgi:DNA helicase II / ATP-dependent DNA helicase PcrA
VAARVEVTDEDIGYVEQLMNRDFSDEERRKLLKHIESCEVQACPGSGKTTLLVAKLALLSKKLPEHHTGICVLTHTNAAREEVEASLGSLSSRLFHHPHFVGTIQSFVNRFLAVPAMVDRHGTRPAAIDDEVYSWMARKNMHRIPHRLRHFLRLNDSEGSSTHFVRQLRYRFRDQGLCRMINGRERPFPAREHTSSYMACWNLKEEIAAQGYIAYHDAYSIANAYLQKYPGVASLLVHRFPLVFIDEMQDTDRWQWELISRLFQGHVVIQCYGDRNQTIFGNSDLALDTDAEMAGGLGLATSLQLTSSFRVSPSVAKLSQNVCVTPQELGGHPSRAVCEHTIFLFDDLATYHFSRIGDEVQAEG